jgi:hypothetical protein
MADRIERALYEVSLYDETHLEPYHREIVEAESARAAVLRVAALDDTSRSVVVDGDGWWRLAPAHDSTAMRFARAHRIGLD